MDIVLNEVLYDPAGADGGYEFVELAAGAGVDPAASLAGWALETANGADGVWRVAWVGGPGDRLGAGRFVVGESGVEPPPDAVRDLDLQNGPDACRLVAPDGARDVLGWGEPLAAGLFEGEPAADVTGESLARRPDGLDTDNNAADFFAAVPSPGAFNSPEHSVQVQEFVAPPVGHPPGASWVFRWGVRNVGRADWGGPVRAECGVHPGEILAEGWPAAPVPSGVAASLEVSALPPAGAHLPVSVPGAGASAVPWLGLGVDVAVVEVYPRPPPDEPEWIEIEVVGERAVDLAALRLEDAAGSGAALAGAAVSGPAVPGARVLLTSDAAALRGRWAPPGVVVEVGPWPALNHTGAGVAERVVLLLGAVEVAAASLPGGIAEGVSWERTSLALDGDLAAAWGPSLDPAGATPGRPNSRRGDRLVGSGSAAVLASPSPFSPARDGTALVVIRPERAVAECRVELFDSAGRLLVELPAWRHGEREHRAAWDGRDATGEPAPLGLYLARVVVGGRPLRPAPLVLVR